MAFCSHFFGTSQEEEWPYFFRFYRLNTGACIFIHFPPFICKRNNGNG